MKVNGVVLWRGASLLDGKLIVVIATGLSVQSNNTKTGRMVQTWILRQRISPLRAAYRNNGDYSICGDCPHRYQRGRDGKMHRTCYVNVAQAPQSIWRAYKRGRYPAYNPALHDNLLRGRAIRFGSYGDPAAAPTKLWLALAALASKRAGYTHQWRSCDQRLRALVMASADSEADKALAQSMGWRTFRVKTADAPKLANEIVCPASAEAERRRTCETCGACRGAGSGHSIVIDAHGASASKFRFALQVV